MGLLIQLSASSGYVRVVGGAPRRNSPRADRSSPSSSRRVDGRFRTRSQSGLARHDPEYAISVAAAVGGAPAILNLGWRKRAPASSAAWCFQSPVEWSLCAT